VNAPADAQLRLLELQALDSALDRLAHRRRSLPELASIDELRIRLGRLRDEIVVAETEDRDLGREQNRIDADVDVVRQRMARDQQRLDTGAVNSPKELENLSSEIGSLHRRQADLEDAELAVMEQRETLQRQLAALVAERDGLGVELAAAEQRRDSAFAEIDADAASTTEQRAKIAAELAEDLLALYERIRASSGGVGAAALAKGRCEGCHLQMTPVDLSSARAAAPDEVLRCEECRRILVRTGESGL